MLNRLETTPKSKTKIPDHESGQKPVLSTQRSRHHSIQSLDYSLIDGTPIKSHKYLGPVSNISKTCKHTLLKEIMSYASTPSRPILSSETSQSITYEISIKGSEFCLLSNLLQQQSRKLLKGIKTYTQSMIFSLPNTSNIGFLSNSLNYSKIRLLFVSGCKGQLSEIITTGWKNTEINPRSLILSRTIAKSEKFTQSEDIMTTMLVLVPRDNLQKLHIGLYSVFDVKAIVPVYLLEYVY